MATATLVRELDGFTGKAMLYKMDPPIASAAWKDRAELFEYVVVSATVRPWSGVPETYIFGADEDGEVLDWSELGGSVRGIYDHETALSRAGYDIAS